MNNNTRILLKFGLWALTGFILVLIGVSRVNALTTTTIYANANRTQSNKYLYSLLTEGGTENVQIGNIGTNYTGRAIGISFWYNDNIVLNKTYKVRVNFYSDDLVPTFNSSMLEINTCSGDTCNPTNLVGISKQNNSGYSTWVQFEYTPQMVGNYVRVDIGNNKRDYITGITYFGINSVQIESVNQNEDIMNNANQNANNIINNNNSNTQNIIDNDTSNTQAIIDNQNSSTQALIDAGYTCNEQTLTNYDGSENKALNVNGSIETANNFVVSDYIRLKASDTYTLTKESWGNARAYCLYDSNQSLINCYTYASNTTFTITGADYIRYTWSKQSNREVSLTGNICLKDSEEQTKTSKGILAKIKELISGLFDTSGPDTDSLNGMAGYLPPGPVDSILTLPLTFFNQLNTSLGGTCSALNVNLPFVNKSLSLPCWSSYMSDNLPNFNTLWTFIGAIASIVILYRYLLALYVWVDNVLMLRYNLHEDFGGNSSNFGGV